MILKTHVSLDSAHKLKLPYDSKCNQLHGHRWEIDIEIASETTINGMIIDFTTIKDYFKKYDHCYLNDLFSLETTAENLAFYFANELKDIYRLQKVKITIAETPNNKVEYEIQG